MESLICRLDDNCEKLLICKLDLECKKTLHFDSEISMSQVSV
jgi:DNA-directed primase/polymerase protein